MSQLEFFDIPSPCIGVCELNNRGYCKGCLRSRDERQQWLTYSPVQKRNIIRLCQQRKARVQAARNACLAQRQQELALDVQRELFDSL